MSLIDDLRNHPEKTTVTLLGTEYDWLLSGYGMKKARQASGLDVVKSLFSVLDTFSRMFDGAEDVDQQDPESIEEAVQGSGFELSDQDIEALQATIFGGLITFPDFDDGYEDLLRVLTISETFRILPHIMPSILSFMEDSASAMEAQAQGGEAQVMDPSEGFSDSPVSGTKVEGDPTPAA